MFKNICPRCKTDMQDMVNAHVPESALCDRLLIRQQAQEIHDLTALLSKKNAHISATVEQCNHAVQAALMRKSCMKPLSDHNEEIAVIRHISGYAKTARNLE